MEKYDYRQAVMDDIRAFINEHSIQVTNINREDVESFLYDTLYIDDSVTGNASGSYTFNTWKAEEYLCHNLDLLADACYMSGDPATYRDCLESAETADVIIRCHVLSECLSSVLDELEIEEEDEYRMDGDK